jgi:hypothetical protein
MSLTVEGEPESRVPTRGESVMEACIGTEGSAQQGFKMWPIFFENRRNSAGSAKTELKKSLNFGIQIQKF